MHFEVVGEITEIELIASGSSIRILPLLRRRHAEGDGGNSKAELWCGLLTEPSVPPNFIGLRLTGSANGK